MRIAIAAPSSVPFRLGGAERAWNGLLRELVQTTPHQADLIKLPAPEESLVDVISGYEAFAHLDLSSFDLLITTKYPAWITFHEQHVVYLFHPLRALYDLYPPHLPKVADMGDLRARNLQRLLRRRPERTLLQDVFGRFRDLVSERGLSDPAFAVQSPLARELVHFLDRVALDPRYVSRHLALSRTVAGRRDYFPPQASVEVLYLPPSIEGFECRGFEYLFTPSRLEGNKRIDLLVGAMRHVAADVSLKIAGTGPELDRLRALAAEDSRIELLGSLSDNQLIDAYADALAVPVVPHDEELGLVTLEAMRSGKPVITCHDSGGPTELVEHGRSGLVTEPTPQAIAAAIDRLAADRQLARSLGEAGRRRAVAFTWHHTVTRLVQPYGHTGETERRPGRSKVVIASTARVHPPRAAGELRSAHLARVLASEFDVEIVSLGTSADRPSRRIIAAGMVETLVPRSQAQAEAEVSAAEEVGLPVEDLLAAEAGLTTPEYGFALARACRSAAVLVLSRPYMFHAAAVLPRSTPLVYHAHCAEAQMWAAVLPHTPEGERLLELACSVERRALLHSELTVASTPEDARLFREDAIHRQPVVSALGLDPAELRWVEPHERSEARRTWLDVFLEQLPRRPTVDGVALFLGGSGAVDVDAARQVAALANHLPDVLHVIVGCRREHLTGVPPPNVVLIEGLPESMKHALLAAADLALFPVAHAGCLRLELAECLAAGIPSISTSAGSYGLPLEDGVHALVRELREFPTAVRQLLAEPALAAGLSREGRHLVELHYDAATAAQCMVAAVQEAVGTGSSRVPAATL
jgi:glycosyltransferase involved in cell wall biosynthesis